MGPDELKEKITGKRNTMDKFHYKFTGRKLGAIGIFESFSGEMEADSIYDVRDNLYKEYEHLHGLCITNLTQNYDSQEEVK